MSKEYGVSRIILSDEAEIMSLMYLAFQLFLSLRPVCLYFGSAGHVSLYPSQYSRGDLPRIGN